VGLLARRGAVRVLVSLLIVQDPNNLATMNLMRGELSSKSFVVATNRKLVSDHLKTARKFTVLLVNGFFDNNVGLIAIRPFFLVSEDLCCEGQGRPK
jgi:hypothetical protein